MERLRAGAIGGLLAGIPMLALNIINYSLRLFPYSPLQVAADLLFSSRVATHPLLGPLLGIAVYLAVGAFYGAVFVGIFGLSDGRNYVWPAILYALGVGVLNMGILAPVLGVVREPFWRLGGITIFTFILRHTVWGAGLGWFVNVYAELHQAART